MIGVGGESFNSQAVALSCNDWASCSHTKCLSHHTI